MGLDNLRMRLGYNGGDNQQNRMIEAKLRSLKKALLYSYQAQTAVLEDGREFRCLINPDKTKADYDAKKFSIPFEDICLNKPKIGKTSHGIEKIDIKCGDVFKWKETGTYWLVYLRHFEETAYFRADIYRCEEELEINRKTYHIYVRGPVETTIQWNQRKEMTWNDINYSLIIYIQRNEDTLNYFSRFKKVKVGGKTWEVKTVDPYSADGIIEINLGEYFENSLEDYKKDRDLKEEQKQQEENNSSKKIYIDGDRIVHPYEKHKYIIYGLLDGKWEVNDSKKAEIYKSDEISVIVNFKTGKSGKIKLLYKTDTDEIEFPIEIKSI